MAMRGERILVVVTVGLGVREDGGGNGSRVVTQGNCGFLSEALEDGSNRRGEKDEEELTLRVSLLKLVAEANRRVSWTLWCGRLEFRRSECRPELRGTVLVL